MKEWSMKYRGKKDEEKHSIIYYYMSSRFLILKK